MTAQLGAGTFENSHLPQRAWQYQASICLASGTEGPISQVATGVTMASGKLASCAFRRICPTCRSRHQATLCLSRVVSKNKATTIHVGETGTIFRAARDIKQLPFNSAGIRRAIRSVRNQPCIANSLLHRAINFAAKPNHSRTLRLARASGPRNINGLSPRSKWAAPFRLARAGCFSAITKKRAPFTVARSGWSEAA